MVALSKRHTIYEWSAQGAVDPIPVARAKGVYFWTPDGKRYPRLQQSADVREHRPRRRARHPRHPGPGGDARLRQPVHGDRGPGAPRRQAGDDHAGRHRHASSSPTAAPKPTRTPSRWPAGSPAATKILARYRSYHGGTGGAITLTGDPRRWAAEPGIPGVVHVPDFYHGVNRAAGHRRGSAGAARGSDRVGRREDHRRLHHRAGHRHQRHPGAAGRLSRGHPRAVRQARHPARSPTR